MTVIRPNSVSGITSITAQVNEINFFRSNGALAGLQLNGVNFNTTTGVSTFNNLNVGGVLTYQDVTNVDSLGIGTFRTGVNVSGGQLDVGSNIKLGNAGVITATSFVGSGANLTGITQVGGSTGVDFNDNVKARFGTGNDLEIYHNAVSNILATSNGNIELVAGSEYMAKFIPNGAVELYHDNSKKLETHSGGINVTGSVNPTGNVALIDNSKAKFGNSDDLSIFHDGNRSAINNATNELRILSGGDVIIGKRSGSDSSYSEQFATFKVDGAVELYHNNSKKFETVTGGIKVTGAYALAASSGNNPTIDNADGGQGRSLYFKTGGSARLIIQDDGHTRPASNNTFDLGTTSDRWRNIYTMDLHCSNKGSSNDVDGTWGDYTIQEGENDLFLINNRSGKKYKFNLTEVS